MHLVGFFIRMRHNALFSECQNVIFLLHWSNTFSVYVIFIRQDNDDNFTTLIHTFNVNSLARIPALLYVNVGKFLVFPYCIISHTPLVFAH